MCKLIASSTTVKIASTKWSKRHSREPSWLSRIEAYLLRRESKYGALSLASTAVYASTMTKRGDTSLQVTAFTRMKVANTRPFLLNCAAAQPWKIENNMKDRLGENLKAGLKSLTPTIRRLFCAPEAYLRDFTRVYLNKLTTVQEVQQSATGEANLFVLAQHCRDFRGTLAKILAALINI